MCMRNGAVFCAAVLIAVSPAFAQAPQFGQPIAPADIAPWDISIGPDGAGLPAGRGSAKQGEAVYAAKCRACHAPLAQKDFVHRYDEYFEKRRGS